MRDMIAVIKAENHVFSPRDLDGFLARADHLDIAELFRQTVGPSAYYLFLRDRYRRPVRPSALHKAIARLPVKAVFTTNYDKLLETAFRRSGLVDPPVVVFPEQLNYIDEDEVRIIKVHGDIDHPRSIVLTRSDYAAYAARHREFVDLLQTSINGRTMLFIGFGLRDLNFRRIYSDARNFFDSTNRQSYAFMTGTNAVERQIWHDEGLTILPLARYTELPACIGRLSVT